VPELPEVETIVRDLRPRVVGRTLRYPRLYHTDVLRDVTARRLLATLRNARVEAVARRAKHAVFLLRNGARLVIQPRMTGSLVVYTRRLRADECRHAVLEVSLGRGERLVFRDVRRLGTIHLLDDGQWAAYDAAIGPEPLAPEFSAVAFAARLRGSRQAIKKVLMDQRRVAGVGNIYANEALFRARIDPSRPAHRLSDQEYAALHAAVRDILAAAIGERGTTVRDYRTGTGQAGSYQFVLQVYGRGGEPCRWCRSLLATTHAIDGRATTFCWRCQGAATATS
jgi:formamidopyrimidine-DNA glycosylase